MSTVVRVNLCRLERFCQKFCRFRADKVSKGKLRVGLLMAEFPRFGVFRTGRLDIKFFLGIQLSLISTMEF